MQTEARNASAFQTAGELVGEENISQLGLTIDTPGRVATVVIDIVEVDGLGHVVRIRRHVHNAHTRVILSRALQQIQQRASEQEMAKVIGSHLHLQPVGTADPIG
jgi:hypothetical protein